MKKLKISFLTISTIMSEEHVPPQLVRRNNGIRVNVDLSHLPSPGRPQSRPIVVPLSPFLSTLESINSSVEQMRTSWMIDLLAGEEEGEISPTDDEGDHRIPNVHQDDGVETEVEEERFRPAFHFLDIQSIPLAVERSFECAVCYEGSNLLVLPCCGKSICGSCIRCIERPLCPCCRALFDTAYLRRLN